MKILTTIHQKKNLDQILKVADGIILGQKDFSKTITHDFEDDIHTMIKQTHNQDKEVYILLNKIYTDKELIEVKNYIEKLPVDLITGFFGADLGLIEIFKTIGIEKKFVYNPETLLTNDVDFNDLSSEGIKGAFVSKEITLEDVLDIAQLKKYEMFYFGHGHMSMFYSKRLMLQTFSDHQDKENKLHKDTSLRLVEEKRLNEAYPVLEDDAGTHVFRGHVFNSFKALDKLENNVDYFVIDTLFMDDDYALKIIPMYKTGIIDERIFTDYNQILHDGFLFDESTIKGEKND